MDADAVTRLITSLHKRETEAIIPSDSAEVNCDGIITDSNRNVRLILINGDDVTVRLRNSRVYNYRFKKLMATGTDAGDYYCFNSVSE